MKKPPRVEGYDDGLVLERPDGLFYWQDPRTGKEYGPFATLIEAIADMDVEDAPAEAEEPLEVGETLEEAEAEMGVASWIDPDTGALAEETTRHLSPD